MAADAPLRPDYTLDELRAALVPRLARHAAFDGWSKAAVENAARDLGVDSAIALLAFDDGPVSMIASWFAAIDGRMAQAHSAADLAAMKIRARITALVEARLLAIEPDREALRRALAVLAMPQNMRTAARLGWKVADEIWHLAGDRATDYNHYTKRATLSAVYAATMLVFLNDESEGHADTRAFLARRIDGVMRFEQAKARFSSRNEYRLSPSRFFGRLRYPAR